MPWIRKKFKNCKVYVLVDDNNNIITENGLAQIKYQQTDEKTYNAKASDIVTIEENSSHAETVEETKTVIKQEKINTTKQEKKDNELGSTTGIIEMYTDGACIGNPGPAGIGVVLKCGHHHKEISKFIGHGTNNIAELTAIKIGLESLKSNEYPVKVYTDSQYSMSVLNGTYKAKKNTALVNTIKSLLSEFKQVEIIKVLGHSGIPENERADRLANLAIQAAQNE